MARPKGVVMFKVFDNFIKYRLLPFLFISSRHLLRFDELLEANLYHEDGLLVDPRKLGLRLKLTKAYITYLFLINIAILPILGIFHNNLIGLNCHVSILLVMVITWLFFALFAAMAIT